MMERSIERERWAEEGRAAAKRERFPALADRDPDWFGLRAGARHCRGARVQRFVVRKADSPR